MAIVFYEGRDLPKEFQKSSGYSGYGDSTQEGAAKIFDSISPFKFLEKLFVDKPAAERQAQVDIARAQALAQGQALQAKAETTEDLLKYGALAVGALVLLIVLTKRRAPAKKVAGYRRKSRSRRSRT